MRFVRNNAPSLFAAVLAVLVLAEPALAADHGGEGEDKLGFLGLKRYDLGIYTLIVFGLLMFVLSRYAWPKMAQGLRKREAAIVGARDEAQKALKDAEELRTKLKADLARTQEEIRAMYEQARKDIDALKAQEREAADKAVAERKAAAERDIAARAEAVKQELTQYAVQLAATLSAKAIRRQISPDDHRRLLDEALAELKTGVGSR
jgi:F-type H+-transporting ATPase subunit b